MEATKAQYIIDTKGKNICYSPIKNYERLLEELEDIGNVCLYDEAKTDDEGEYILFSDYLKNRKKNNVFTLTVEHEIPVSISNLRCHHLIYF